MAVLPRNICIVAIASVLIAGCTGGSLKSDHTLAQERVQSYLAANSSLEPAIARAIGRMELRPKNRSSQHGVNPPIYSDIAQAQNNGSSAAVGRIVARRPMTTLIFRSLMKYSIHGPFLVAAN
jgi:hypothetical protein